MASRGQKGPRVWWRGCLECGSAGAPDPCGLERLIRVASNLYALLCSHRVRARLRLEVSCRQSPVLHLEAIMIGSVAGVKAQLRQYPLRSLIFRANNRDNFGEVELFEAIRKDCAAKLAGKSETPSWLAQVVAQFNHAGLLKVLQAAVADQLIACSFNHRPHAKAVLVPMTHAAEQRRVCLVA
jgi:hypothetical protein